MKSVLTPVLGFSLMLLGVLAAAPTAHAVTVDYAGSICTNYNAAEATLIDYFPNGARSYKTSETSVICPLARYTNNANGAWVYVDINHTDTQTTRCTAYSHNFDGTRLGFVSASWTGSGFHEIALNLTGAGMSTAWSNYSVLCSIPGTRKGMVYGIALYEQ
jgi:hypothetical protein